MNPRWIITSALAGYTSVAARSRLLLLGVFTTRLWRKPADQRVIVSPSPESLKRPFQLETDFIFGPWPCAAWWWRPPRSPWSEETEKREGTERKAEVAARPGRERRGAPGRGRRPRRCCSRRSSVPPEEEEGPLERVLLLLAAVAWKREPPRRTSGAPAAKVDEEEEDKGEEEEAAGEAGRRRRGRRRSRHAADLPAPRTAELPLQLPPLLPSLASADAASLRPPRIVDRIREKTRCQQRREK